MYHRNTPLLTHIAFETITESITSDTISLASLSPTPEPQISAEDEKITVPLNVAKMSKMVCDSMGEEEDEITDQEFPIPKVSTDVLNRVVEYCTHYQTVEKMNKITLPFEDDDDTVLKIVKQQWYADFVKNENDEDFKTNNKLISASNFMNISPLLDLACLSESVYIKGFSAEKLRELYNLPEPELIATEE